jgi:hypothetical protein
MITEPYCELKPLFTVAITCHRMLYIMNFLRSLYRLVSGFSVCTFLAALTLAANESLAWGRIGHQIVCQTSANLMAHEPKGGFMKNHSFDFGYYCNVPDFIWKRPASYEQERGEHYMNLEVFERAFKLKPDVKEPFQLSRQELQEKFPELKPEFGRAFWRIRERVAELEKLKPSLQKAPAGKDKQELQGKWIVIAGTLGHYLGDLGMPLHVSENHDGQLTSQKGIHSFFEDACVDQIYPDVQAKTEKLAQQQWSKFKEKNKDKTVLQLLLDLSASSMKASTELLALDKKNGRKDRKAACLKFMPLIEARLTAATLTLAEIYRRQIDFDFDDDRFYFFSGEPEYAKPGAM